MEKTVKEYQVSVDKNLVAFAQKVKDGKIERNTQYNDSNNKPSPTIVYTKRVNGYYYVVEAVPDTKAGNLQLVTAYKNKGGQVSDGTNSTPATNVRNVHAASHINKITNSGKNVNTQNEKIEKFLSLALS